MISDVDLRDWEHTILVAREAAHGVTDKFVDTDRDFLLSFIDKVEALVFMNQKQVAALFKPPEYSNCMGLPKQVDGCCHQTVTKRCLDCSFKDT